MKTIECKCNTCNKTFIKPLNEYNRQVKLGRTIFYCSRVCAGKNTSNLKRLNIQRDLTKLFPGGWNKGKSNPFNYYIRNIKRRGLEVNIDSTYLENLWNSQNGICPYSKVNLTLNSHSKKALDPRYTASLDRIDSTKGYVDGNVQFVSTCMNYMKYTMSHTATLQYLKEITNNLNSTFVEDRTISSSVLDVGR